MFGPVAGPHVEQIALIASAGHAECRTIGGGRVLLVSELFSQILRQLAELDPSSALVPEQWPLIRTLQWAVACNDGLLPAVQPGELVARNASLRGAHHRIRPRSCEYCVLIPG